MELFKENLTPWFISNSIAILILVASIKKPRLSRLLFALMFLLASWVNYSTVITNPSDYLNYASLTPFAFYQSFIDGWFKAHIVQMITLIAIGQFLIGLGMLLKRIAVQIACLGAIVFFIAILPLGIGSAFPFSLVCLLALYFILKKGKLNYLWVSK